MNERDLGSSIGADKSWSASDVNSTSTHSDSKTVVEMSEGVRAEREKIWEAKRQNVREITDALGERIDPGIEETVIALNVSGIRTNASCEGHADRDIAAPWVDIAADPDMYDEMFEGEEDVAEEVAQKYGISTDEVTRGWSDNDVELAKRAHSAYEKGRAKAKLTKEFQIWVNGNDRLRDKAQKELEKFYADRKVPDDVRLQLNGPGYIHRLHNGGEDYMTDTEVLSDTDRIEIEGRLSVYRAEMEAFAAFLKEKFMSSKGS